MPMARALDLTVTPWGCVGSGILSGKYNADAEAKGRAAMRGQISERALGIAGEVIGMARALGKSPTQVALNWVRQGEGVVVPLVGARTVAQLRENLDCLDFELTPEQMEKLNSISEIEMGFPHDMLSMQQARNRKVDNHRV
jgi:aryl-alcohol dehydrogenase-like predicted oxidoreductase